MGVHEWLLKRGYKYEVVQELHEWLDVYRKESERGEFAQDFPNGNWASWLDAYRDFQAYLTEKERYESIRYDERFDSEMGSIYREG